jgi:hypothetical protein
VKSRVDWKLWKKRFLASGLLAIGGFYATASLLKRDPAWDKLLGDLSGFIFVFSVGLLLSLPMIPHFLGRWKEVLIFRKEFGELLAVFGLGHGLFTVTEGSSIDMDSVLTGGNASGLEAAFWLSFLLFTSGTRGRRILPKNWDSALRRWVTFYLAFTGTVTLTESGRTSWVLPMLAWLTSVLLLRAIHLAQVAPKVPLKKWRFHLGFIAFIWGAGGAAHFTRRMELTHPVFLILGASLWVLALQRERERSGRSGALETEGPAPPS